MLLEESVWCGGKGLDLKAAPSLWKLSKLMKGRLTLTMCLRGDWGFVCYSISSPSQSGEEGAAVISVLETRKPRFGQRIRPLPKLVSRFVSKVQVPATMTRCSSSLWFSVS